MTHPFFEGTSVRIHLAFGAVLILLAGVTVWVIIRKCSALLAT